MSVSVRIPTILRTYTDGESEVTAAGSTLSDVLDDLDAKYAGIKGRILDEAGELRRFVNVYVGNDDVRFLDSLATATPDGTQISVIPAVAGGLSLSVAGNAHQLSIRDTAGAATPCSNTRPIRSRNVAMPAAPCNQPTPGGSRGSGFRCSMNRHQARLPSTYARSTRALAISTANCRSAGSADRW